ncbi:hypothetical protein [Magnetofaba australis]|uniref:Uncharacterized protein n=1 Tax=Magnetofaba australis IT-1 TaxID=1434232 RepID=A0A1Y2K141_9PROT|nr:hypothetical protein [Magnetofaba australis]OSM00473.1 hypothetical protein MAIT1_01002 [Magnetofaba australis IT-1]
MNNEMLRDKIFDFLFSDYTAKEWLIFSIVMIIMALVYFVIDVSNKIMYLAGSIGIQHFILIWIQFFLGWPIKIRGNTIMPDRPILRKLTLLYSMIFLLMGFVFIGEGISEGWIEKTVIPYLFG